jgi:hypothetical protein
MTDTYPDIDALLHDLQHDEVEQVVTALRSVHYHPTGDPRVVSAVESLLEDTRLCILFIPIHYGYVNYLAGQALASERGMQGNMEPVLVRTTLQPLTSLAIRQLATQYAIPFTPSLSEVIRQLEVLGKAPLLTRFFAVKPPAIPPLTPPE